MECVLNVACSVSKKKWVQRTGKVQNPERIVSAIIQRHRLPEVIARCLVGRNVDLDDIDLENDSYLDSAIETNSYGDTNLKIYEFQQAYALKRDLYYAYAERSFLMKKSYSITNLATEIMIF